MQPQPTPKALHQASLEDVHLAAELAQLHLDPSQHSAYLSDLQQLDSHAAALANLDTTEVEPLIHLQPASHPLREDVPSCTNQRQVLQQLAPAVEAGLYLVPRVVE